MAEITREPHNSTPSTVRRRMFLSGVPIAKALQPFLPKPRDSKAQKRFAANPEKIPSGGGSGSRSSKPRKKLTGTVSLKIRKQMLAVKLRKAGCRTVAGYCIKRDAMLAKAAKRAAQQTSQEVAA